MKIRCEYKNGEIKEFTPGSTEKEKGYKKVIENLIKSNKEKKGRLYFKFKNSNLDKLYVDDKLLLYKEV